MLHKQVIAALMGCDFQTIDNFRIKWVSQARETGENHFITGNEWCKGQVYHLVAMRCYDWGTYHRTMMEILGREVEMVEVPLATLQASPHFEVSPMITTNFIYNGYYAGDKIARDIPEFCPSTDLKTGLTKQLEFLEERNLIPNSDDLTWEDELIEAQRQSVIYLQSLTAK